MTLNKIVKRELEVAFSRKNTTNLDEDHKIYPDSCPWLFSLENTLVLDYIHKPVIRVTMCAFLLPV
jgi:hypothetical protein